MVVGHGCRHEAHAAPGGHEREDLLDARGLGCDAAGKAVAVLLGEPPRRRAVASDGRVDDKALVAQVCELQRSSRREWMRCG
jgi:hypothetical protein